MARIGIDIDSTLHQYWDLLDGISRRRFGVALPYAEQHDWGVSALDPGQLAEAVAESHCDANVESAEPYAGAVEAVSRWHHAGHFIHITSHRSSAAFPATERWLGATGIPFDDLHCSYDKVTRCVELNIDLLVDDSPANIRRARREGIATATLIHPWTQPFVADDDVITAADWPELEAGLADLLGTQPA